MGKLPMPRYDVHDRALPAWRGGVRYTCTAPTLMPDEAMLRVLP
jgi:hypothetical protein